jgi:hypothetical protein
MSEFEPTYVYQDDDVFAIYSNQVIASGSANDLDKVESDALEYLEHLKAEKAIQKRNSATHIVTPNGLKGRIMNRFENGETARFPVSARFVGEWLTEKTASTANPIEKLAGRLNSNYEHDRRSLVSRHEELQRISNEAKDLVLSGVSYADQIALDEIRVTADVEDARVTDAIHAIDSKDVEAYAPPKTQVVEQAGVGRDSGDWLSVVVDDMVSEAEGTDFDKLLQEGPDLLAAGLDDTAVANQGVARDIALSHVTSKTVAFVGEDVEQYRDQFLARFEMARRREAANRTSTRKEAAATVARNVADTPDEALFG